MGAAYFVSSKCYDDHIKEGEIFGALNTYKRDVHVMLWSKTGRKCVSELITGVTRSGFVRLRTESSGGLLQVH